MTREQLLEKAEYLKTLRTANVRGAGAHLDNLPLISEKWSDDEIVAQLKTYFESKQFSERALNDYYISIRRFLPTNLAINDLKEYIKLKLYDLFGWKDLVPMNSEFWQPFHNIAYNLIGVLTEGMHKDYFTNVLKYHGFIDRSLNGLDEWYKTYVNLEKLKNQIHTSPYKNMDEMEEELSVKRIGAAAKEFYLDRTKDISERVKVFSKYGEEQSWIWKPQDFDLHKIFEMHGESGVERHEIVYCANVIEWWIECLSYRKTKIDYHKNRFHPELKQEYRNYKPSEESINRLYRYYMEKIFLYGIGKFDFDW